MPSPTESVTYEGDMRVSYRGITDGQTLVYHASRGGMVPGTAGGQDVSVVSYGATGDGSTNDYQAIADAIAAVATLGGNVYFPPGTYKTNTQIVVPGGVRLLGTSLDFSVVTAAPARGSIIKAGAAIASAVALSDDPTSTASGKTGASMDNMIVDGAGVATAAVTTNGRRNYIQRCQIWRGATYALDMQGQNGYLLDSVIGQNNTGSVIHVGNVDNKIIGNQIREAGSGAQILLDGAATVEINGNHMYGSHAAGGGDIEIINSPAGLSGIRIVNNTIEGTAGHHILYTAPASTTVNSLQVVGNTFYQIAGAWITDNTYDVLTLDMTAASSVLRQVIFNDNIVSGNGVTYRAMVNKISSGTLEQTCVMGNQASAAVLLVNNFTPDTYLGNTSRYFNGSTTDIYRSDNRGAITLSGDGATTAFNIPHGLTGTPLVWSVTPTKTAAKTDLFVTADATNLVVTFGTAPANSANNLGFVWTAQK
jgi:hypothetical protein